MLLCKREELGRRGGAGCEYHRMHMDFNTAVQKVPREGLFFLGVKRGAWGGSK